jgi:non-specific serine/threonine protein kinase
MSRAHAWLAAGLLALAACLSPGQGGAAPVGAAEIAPRRALGAAVLEGRVFAVGGWSGAATQLDTVEILDAGRWTAGPPLAVARSQHALVTAEGGLWALGGWSATAGLVSEVEVLGPAGARWTTVTHLPTPRREPGAALLGRRIVVAGGFDGASDADLEGYRDTVEAYDLDAGRWMTLARLNTPRRGLGLVAIGDEAYALGGYTADGDFSAAAERYDPARDSWTALNWPIVPRTWAAAVVVDGRVLTLGGEEPGGIGGAAEWIETECQP